MKSLVAAVAAASLVGMSMVQASPATQPQRPKLPEQLQGIERIPEKDQLKALEPKFGLDACHKVDSRTADGWEWPCSVQLKFNLVFCVLKADTEAARKDQQTCMCKTGSYFKDADACLDCKVRHGLIGDEQDVFYQKVFGRLSDIYCNAEVVEKDFYKFYMEAEDDVKNAAPYNGVQPGFKVPSSVERQGHSAHPREYYSRVGAPEKQGEGNVTPSTQLENMPTVNKTIANPIPDAVNVPVMVIVALDNATDAKNASGSAGPTAGPTATPVVGQPLQPTTLVRLTSMNSTARATASPSASLLSHSVASSLPSSVPANVPANVPADVPADVQAQIIIIEGKRCLVYIYFVQVNFHCSKSPQGKIDFTQKSEQIDWTYGFQLETKEHFDQLANVPDACTVGDCQEQISYIERVKKVSIGEVVQKETVVPVKPQQLPPPEKPATGGNSGVPGNVKPADEDDDGCRNGVSNDAPGNNTPTQGGSGSPAKGNTDSSGPVSSQKDTNSGPVSSQKDTTSGPVSSQKDNSGPVSSQKDTTSGPVSSQKDNSGPVSSQKDTTSGPAGPSSGQSECGPCSEERKDGTEICAKKVQTEDFCKTQSGEDVRNCLCSRRGYEDKRFFEEAIDCARLSGNCADREYTAQTLFETKSQYCEQEKYGSVSETLEVVENVWSERAPRHRLM